MKTKSLNLPNFPISFRNLARGAAFAAMLCSAGLSNAATVTLNTADGIGQSSFNTGTRWSDGQVPDAANDYVVSIPQLRTPADGSSHTFGGNSLTIDTGGRFFYKGTGSAATITVGNLTLNGGTLEHQNGSADVFRVAGTIDIAADSQIWAKQGLVAIDAAVSGSGNITNPSSDGPGRILVLSSPDNTYSGSIVNNGRFQLADDARLNFVIGGNGVNNSVSGTGAETLFDGDFNFDLSGASSTFGHSWTIASAAGQTFGSTFTVVGFDDIGGNVWTTFANGTTYAFSEATGVLAVVPEPGSVALMAGGLLTLLGFRRFRRS